MSDGEFQINDDMTPEEKWELTERLLKQEEDYVEEISLSRMALSSLKLKDLVKDNFVKFDYFKEGIFHYILRAGTHEEYTDYSFEVPLDGLGNAALLDEDKAIFFMRWIRKALESGKLKEI